MKKLFNIHTGFLYLHGFLSSPESLKAKQFKVFCKNQGIDEKAVKIPQLPTEPDKAIKLCKQIVKQLQNKYSTLVIVGSSLGGYYATYLSEEFRRTLANNQTIYTVLVNPAVKPYTLLNQHVGIQKHYHNGQEVEIKQEHIEQLKKLDVDYINDPKRYLVLLQTADETLDYKQAASFYEPCTCLIEAGGSHAFENFDSKIPMIMEFVEQYSD